MLQRVPAEAEIREGSNGSSGVLGRGGNQHIEARRRPGVAVVSHGVPSDQQVLNRVLVEPAKELSEVGGGDGP